MRITRNDVIEARAESVLLEYERKIGEALVPPIPLEQLLLQVYGISLDYDELEELPGETILGGIVPARKRILLNTKHLELFEQKPGLEASTIGHEAGHWEFHVNKASVGQPSLFAQCEGVAFRRSAVHGEVAVFDIFTGDETIEQFLEAHRRRDTHEQERVANRFAAALNMPKKLVYEHFRRIESPTWPDLYRLAELFRVNISALRVRLEQLNLLYVDEQKRIHRSREEAGGQLRLI